MTATRTASQRMAAASESVPQAHGAETLGDYVAGLVHAWCRLLSVLAGFLLLLFIPIDYLLFPRALFAEVLTTRLLVVAIVFGTFVVMRVTRPGGKSYAFSHFLAALVGTMVAVLTTFTGGFDSPYYAAFNLLIVAINLVLPWGLIHTLINTALLVGLYVGVYLAVPQDTPPAFAAVINNMAFIACTSVFAIVGSTLKQRLTREEFALRMRCGRRAMSCGQRWGSQSGSSRRFLPTVGRFGDYEVAALRTPHAARSSLPW